MVESYKYYGPKDMPLFYRGLKVQLAAEFSDVKLDFVPDFKCGVTEKSPDFLKKFPLGSIPSVETKEGVCISDADAIINLIGSDDYLMRKDMCLHAQVHQYMNWASNTVDAASCVVGYPAIGLCRPDKSKIQPSKTKLHQIMDTLDKVLLTRTYLVGERITAADVAVFVEFLLPFKFTFKMDFIQKHAHVLRWFNTVLNHPKVMKYVPEFEFCTVPVEFNADRFFELHPEEKNKPAGGKAAQNKNVQKQQPNKKQAAQQPAQKPAETKKKADLFAGIPPTTFVLDDFKRVEANNDARTVTIPYLWEKLDKEGFSFWQCEYKYANEFSKKFMLLNFINNTIDGVQGLSKHIFGIFLVYGEEKNFKLRFLLMCRGQEFIFNLPHDAIFDTEIFDYKKLDIVADKKTIEEFFAKEAEYDGLKPIQNIALR